MRTGDRKKEIPLKELSKYFRVPSRGIAVDYPGREVLLASRITNISSSGVFVRTRSPFPMGSRITIAFQLPTAPHVIMVGCVVRWSTAARPRASSVGHETLDGMGLEFTKIARADRRAIALYIEDFLSRMRR